MKRLTFAILTSTLLITPAKVLAAEEQIICSQPYGGGVVCGVHTVVNTGLGDNLAMIGLGFLASSLIFLILSKKFKSSKV